MMAPRALTPATLLLLIGCTAPALAQEAPTVTLTAAYMRQTDSNLFRLSDANLANAQTLIGRPDASEQIGVTTLGLNLNKAYSLQRFELDLNLVDYNYQNFNYLSFTAKNVNAAWRWALTPRLTGNLTTERKETLNSFADYQGYNTRNVHTASNTGFDAVYEIVGPWRMLAGVSQASQNDQQVILAEGDTTSNSANLGARYVFASGSSFSYTARKTKGSYTNRVLSPTGLYDDGFSETDNEVKLSWQLSGKSSAAVLATQINRSHPNYAQRDYSGVNVGVNANWGITAKTALTAYWTRELASYQTSNTNFSQTDRLTLGPAWQITPKTVLRLRYSAAKLDYLGSPKGLAASPRTDTTTDTALSLDWQPNQRLTFSTSLLNAKRASNQVGFDYDSNMATLSAQYSY